MRKLQLISAFALVVYLATTSMSCTFFGPNANSASVVISGDFSRSISPQHLSVDQIFQNKSLAGAITLVGAMPVVAGVVSVESIDNMIVSQVESDGSFGVTLPREEDTEYVVAILDEGSQGFLSVPVSNEDALVSLPTEDSPADIDFGVLNTRIGNEYSANIAPGDAAIAFGTDLDTLFYRARMDNAAKASLNYYNNYNRDTGEFYEAGKSTLINNNFSAARNQFSIPGQFDSITYQVTIRVNNPYEYEYADIENGTVVVKVYPSHEFGYGGDLGDLYGPEQPFSTDVVEGLGGWLLPPVSGESGYGFSFSVVGDVPAQWSIENNGIPKALLDVEYFDTFVDSGDGSVYRYFFPSIKATINSDNIITAIDVQFYLYSDSSGSYEIVHHSVVEAYGEYSLSYSRLYPDPNNPDEYLIVEDYLEGQPRITEFGTDWVFDDIDEGYSYMVINTSISNFYYHRD